MKDSNLKLGDKIHSEANTYQLSRPLGMGGMYTVYKARHLGTDEDVAVKILYNLELSERALLEEKLLRQLAHPHIVKVREGFPMPMGDSKHACKAFVIVMDLERSDRLMHFMNQGLLTPLRALMIARQVLDALAYAHEMDVVHRDVKPENISLGEGPDGDVHIKLLDFSIAKDLADPTKRTFSYELLGTAPYMSPEQISKDEPIDGRTDLYSLGIMLHEVFTGRLPFLHRDRHVLYTMQLIDRPPSLSKRVPESVHGAWLDQLDAVVARALEKKPADRFTDARAMLEAVDSVIATLQSERRPTSAPIWLPRRNCNHATSWTTTQR